MATARKKRTALYLSIFGLLAMVAAISAVSIEDPQGMWHRIGIVLLVVGSAMWLPWRVLLPAALAIWLAPNYVRSLTEDIALFGQPMLLELPGVLGLAAFTAMARIQLQAFEEEDADVPASSPALIPILDHSIDPITGLYEETALAPAIEAELVRARRFNRQFALVMVGVDELRQRFDYRDREAWQEGIEATARILLSTRQHIDKAFHYGTDSFALLLPESGPNEVKGMVRRLRRLAMQSNPPEGERGGPFATHYGATFFPLSATTVEDLLRRAEVALRLAEKSADRLQIDGAEAAEMISPELLRAPTELPVRAAAGDEDLVPVSEAIRVEERPPNVIDLRVAPAPIADDPDSEVAVAAIGAEQPSALPEPVAAEQEPELRAVDEPVPAMVHVLPQEAASASTANAEPVDLDDEVSDVLQQLDETLSLIRQLRGAAK